MNLQESLNKFIQPNYGTTPRTEETYKTVSQYCTENLTNRVELYHSVENDQQLLREIRNDIDYYLRRYHKYCIQQRDGMKGHYTEVGVDEKYDFEHLIPAARVRDLLLHQVITVSQALNAPTVKLSKAKHEQLAEAGWKSKTPDMWLPFMRYHNVFTAEFETYDGTKINPTTWTLADHFRYFEHLVI